VSAHGERDLAVLLGSMQPRLRDGQWVFVTVEEVPPGVEPLASFVEDEGLSLVVPLHQAVAAGLEVDFVAAWISLTVHSALDAVGLTAAVATVLAEAGISCNVIAARHHDHLLVPYDRAADALALLVKWGDGWPG
jgi:hypothetical protein